MSNIIICKICNKRKAKHEYDEESKTCTNCLRFIKTLEDIQDALQHLCYRYDVKRRELKISLLKEDTPENKLLKAVFGKNKIEIE